jgi:hypothetical protein
VLGGAANPLGVITPSRTGLINIPVLTAPSVNSCCSAEDQTASLVGVAAIDALHGPGSLYRGDLLDRPDVA